MADFVSKLPPVPKNDIPLSYSFVVVYHLDDNVVEHRCVIFQEDQAFEYCKYMNSQESSADSWRWDYVPVVNRIFA